MILVTGATGTVGRPLVELLVSEGVAVRAITRDPRAADLPDGVDVVEGDPSRPDTVAASLAGVTALLLNPAAVGDAAGELLALAAEQGVRRAVLLSALVVEFDSGNAISAHHKELEDTLTGSGLDWVILRPGMFAANALSHWASQIHHGDTVHGPYARSTDAPIHELDLAEVAARALLTDELVGQRLPLTGPQSFTRAEMVTIIGDVLGRPLRYQEIPPETARQAMVAHGVPEPLADAVLSMQKNSVGQPAVTTGEVEKILGHPARTFAQWAAAHAAAFRS
jgi:uncharacterized protein YbjT (DUF2867 family)